MTSRGSGPVPAARTTLRRLRLVLTLALTLTNAVGLSLFAWLAIRSDAENSRERVDSKLEQTAVAVIQDIHDPTAQSELVNEYPSYDSLQQNTILTKSCPVFAVLPGTAKQFAAYVSSSTRCPSATLYELNQVANQATRTDTVAISNFASANGHVLRVLGYPFRLGDQMSGAVVVTVDAQAEIARHKRMLTITVVGCALIVLGLAVVGHLISARAMRPAAQALDQQELFLAESAHDLRTPVAALRALTETAMDNADQRGVLLPRAVSLSQRMSDIIDDLLIRARLASGTEQLNLQPVRLDQLVAGLVEELPATGDGGQVVFTCLPSTVAADYPLLRRAIGNLIDNARKYGHWPGQPSYVEVDVRDGRVIVADYGPGMQGDVPTTPFAGRRRSSAESTGLGLPIVHWVAEAHRGRLLVHNRLNGSGAVFELALPPIRT